MAICQVCFRRTATVYMIRRGGLRMAACGRCRGRKAEAALARVLDEVATQDADRAAERRNEEYFEDRGAGSYDPVEDGLLRLEELGLPAPMGWRGGSI